MESHDRITCCSAVVLMLSAGSAHSQPAPDPGALPLLGEPGIHLYAQEAYEGFSLEISRAVQARHAELVDAGMDCARHLFDWRDIEPTPGNYVLDEVIEALDFRLDSGITHQFCNITVIDSFGAEGSPDFIRDMIDSGVPWDDKRIVDAFGRMLDRVVPLMLERGTYMVGVGNEPGGYYEEFPGLAASYTRFTEKAIARLHSIEPALAGTVVFAGPEDASIPQLMPIVDVAGFNQYAYELTPVQSCQVDGFPVSLYLSTWPEAIGPMLDRLSALAEGKLICIQEFGQSSGWGDVPQTLGPNAGLGAQREIIQALAEELYERCDQYRTVSIWTLNDHTLDGIRYVGDTFTDAGFPSCYGDNLNEIFGPTGLVRSDATASTKPAFDAFKDAVACLSGNAYCPYDADGDGQVDLEDLHHQHQSPADTNGDGQISSADTRLVERFIRRCERLETAR